MIDSAPTFYRTRVLSSYSTSLYSGEKYIFSAEVALFQENSVHKRRILRILNNAQRRLKCVVS